ncbi:MAG: hypothetical protein ACK44N_02215 [Bacteroidota bacterium]|jgi:hypothetical protein
MNLKKSFSKLFLLIVLLTVSCQKDTNEMENTPSSAIRLVKNTLSPYEISLIEVVNITLTDSVYTGLIDGVQNVMVYRLDDGLGFSVPELQDGSHNLICQVGGADYNLVFNVVSLPTIADPVQYVDDYILEYNTLKTQNIANADSLNIAEKNLLLSDLQAVQNNVDVALNNFNAASAQDKLVYAKFLQANKQWMDEFKNIVDNFTNSMNQLKLSGVDDYELKTAYLIVEFEVSKAQFINKTLKYIAAASASFYFGPIVGSITSGVALGLIVNMVDNLAIEYSKIYENILIPFQNIIGLKIASLGFDNGVKKPVTITLEYRTLYNNDVNSAVPNVVKVVSGMNQIKTAWNKLLSYLPFSLSFSPREINQIPTYSINTKQVNSKYLSITSVSPSGISNSVDRTDGDFKVTFTKQNLTAQLPFTFNVKYSAPNMGTVNGAISGLLNPANDSLTILQYMTGGSSRAWKEDPAFATANCCGQFFAADDILTLNYSGAFSIDYGAQQACPDSCEIDEGGSTLDSWQIRKVSGSWMFFYEYYQGQGYMSSLPIAFASDTRLRIGGIEFIRQ